VDGFTRKAEVLETRLIVILNIFLKFIVTEWPKQQTLDSFWTLIFDHNVHTVICLTNQPSDVKVIQNEMGTDFYILHI
jgi:protein tyrosine phosphatase